MDTVNRNLASSMLHGGKPLKSYIKTILGKVYVMVWDSFEMKPVGVLLEGDPRKHDETCIVDVWSSEEDFYFRNSPNNKRHMSVGNVIAYVRKDETREKTIEEFSDEELTSIISGKFFALQSALNGANSVAVLFRIKNLATELEKSDKIMKAIDARISEVQAMEFKPMVAKTTEL